jgi:8-oxo-dGTP diphosphatase
MAQDKQVRVGISVIVKYEKGRQTYVLIGKRKGAHGAGTWAFPGGKLEFGESIAHCAFREVFEETGIRIDPKKLERAPFDFTNDVFEEEVLHYITIFLIAELPKRVEPKLKEPDKCEGWSWYPFGRDPSKPLPDPLFLPVQNWLEQPEEQLPRKEGW